MTAHRPKPVTLTPELVERFMAYYRVEHAWGVLHVSLDDCNYCPVSDLLAADVTDEERELARLHDLMTVSQRRRLADRCSDIKRAEFATRAR